MILEQFYLGCFAHASYIVIDERTKTAAVIDPQRDVDRYLEAAERHGATIEYVLLTHFHADFIAGHLELRERVGARIHLSARAEAEYEFTALEDGATLEFGDVRFRILETPGHTPEGMSIVVYDLAESDRKPHAVFTGDTLFVGDVGRPDLMASVGVTATELAGWLYDSLHQKLMELPDETIVYPAHGAGSMCGKNLSKETFSTIGEQRRLNYALQPMTKGEFTSVVTAEQPEVPAYFGHDAMMNKMERQTLEASLASSVKPLTLDEVLELQAVGAQVVDVREAADFAGAHLAGSVNIGLGGKFATWVGTVLSREKKIVIVAVPGTEHEAAMRMGRIGMDDVVGYLDGGPGAFQGRPDLLASTERVTTAALSRDLEGERPPLVVDIRTPNEFANGHIEGAVNIPLPHLFARRSELPADRGLALVCKSGYRSSIGSSLLLAEGIANLRDVVGGMDAWAEGALPMTGEAPSCTT